LPWFITLIDSRRPGDKWTRAKPAPRISDYEYLARSLRPPISTRRDLDISVAPMEGLASVITACFNSIATIDQVVNSVQMQDYPNVEYIVIDGESTDGTVDRLLARKDAIDLLVSGVDRGISDAFNKGIALSRGEYVMLVNSDDWLEPQHLSTAVLALLSNGADYVFGDLLLHFQDGTLAHSFAGDPEYARRLRHSMPALNHPTVVCRHRTFERFGLFNLCLRIAMDYEWFLRVERGGGRGAYVPGLIGHMALGGESVRAFKRSFREVRKVSIGYGYPPVLAWSRFGSRLLRTGARVVLQRICPAIVYQWLRRSANTDYRNAAR
jgi:glycosyltransferase involved in cell wall biosynthesis